MPKEANPVTDHTYMGQPIVIGKLRGRPKQNRNKARWHPIEAKTKAACLYAVTADFKQVSELTGIPAPQLKSMADEQWWADIIKEVRKEENNQMSAKLTQIANTAFDGLIERLKTGDPVLNAKTGEISFIPIRFRDLANSLGTLIDKRQLLRGDPTTRTDKLGQDEILKLLGDKFESFAKKLTNKPEPQTIESVDYVEVKNGNVSKGSQDQSQTYETNEAKPQTSPTV
jgi:hypothetical protein